MKIITIGKPGIFGDHDEARPVRGHQPWAILARLLLAERPLSRRALAAQFFSATDDPLGALRWCLAALRRATGPETLNGDPIELNFPSATYVDIWNLDSDDFDLSSVAEFLEGIEPAASAEFATWLLIERERISGLLHERLRRDAMKAVSGGNFERAIELAELAVRSRPLEESGHILLVKSLALDGKISTAMAHVEATEQEFFRQLGEKPSAALRAAARKNVAEAPQGVSQGAVIDSLIISGVAAVSAGAVDAGLDCLRRAAADSERFDDTHLYARSLLELGTALVHSIRGFDDEGAIVLRQAAGLACTSGSAQIAASALRELGYIEALAGRRPSAAGYLHEALDFAAGDDDALAGTHAVLGFNNVDWGKVETGLADFEQSLLFARKCGNRRRQIWSLGIGAWGQLRAGRPDVARDWLTACLELCDEVRWVAFQPWPQALLAEADLQLGKHANTRHTVLEECLALSSQLGDPCWEAATARCIGLVHADANEAEMAMKWMAHARMRCCTVTDLYVGLMVEILSDQVKLQTRFGQVEQAAATARELLSLAARTHANAHLQFAVSLVNSAPQSNGHTAGAV